MQNGGKYSMLVKEQFWQMGKGNLPENVELRQIMATNLEMLLGVIGVEQLGALSGYRCDLDEFK